MPVDMENMKGDKEGQRAPAEFKPESKIIEEILTRIQGSTEKDVEWLEAVYADYGKKAMSESTAQSRRNQYSEVIAVASQKLGELGHPIEPQEEEDQRLKRNA
jgi:hypothetical protein